jgi:beta-phosphoglucomutase-like phosphatase (HAD superfamily)
VFEDAPNGVLAGKAAGMTVYGINKDEWWRRELEASGADQVFASLAELTA